MSMKPFFALSGLSLGLVAASAAWSAPLAPSAASPTAAATLQVPTPAATPVSPSLASPLSPAAKTADSPVAVSSPAQPVPPVAAALSGSAQALPATASPTADASGDSLAAEEVGEDGLMPAKTIVPNLVTIDSDTLASLSDSVDRDSDQIFYDPAAKVALAAAQGGAWQVKVSDLYYELAKRTLNDAKDKSARQALALALFKDGDRAKDAKDLAYDDKLADAMIAQVEAKRPKARMELQALAEKGNRKARLYLGMDKPLALPDAAGDTSALIAVPAPVTASATAAPLAVSPAAKAPIGAPLPATSTAKK